MAINLDEHKVYVESHRMEMVPLSTAQQAVTEAISKCLEETDTKLSQALLKLEQGLQGINNIVEELDD